MGWTGPVTHRQYVAWHDWLDEQWNVPTKADFYQMQTALETRRSYVRRPNRVDLKQMQLKFGRDKVQEERAKRADVKIATAAARARWGLRFKGAKVTHTPAPAQANQERSRGS